MFWIGLFAGYLLGFILSWILMNAIRGWDVQDSFCAMDRQGILQPERGDL